MMTTSGVDNEESKPTSVPQLMITAGMGAVPKEEPKPTTLCQLMITGGTEAVPSEKTKQDEKAGQQAEIMHN